MAPNRNLNGSQPHIKKKVLILDDHPLLRQGLSIVINHEEDIAVCAEAEDSKSALELIQSSKPDVVIADISLKEENGLNFLAEAKARHPKLFILVVSMHDETFYAERALRAGAQGYVMKQENSAVILKALRTVLNGQIYLSERIADKLLRSVVGDKQILQDSPVERLSNRELEVLELLGTGLTPHLIAEKINVSVKTVESYRSHLKSKLSIGNADELRQFAIQWVRRKSD